MSVDISNMLLDKLGSRGLEFPSKERVTITPNLQSMLVDSSQFRGKSLV